MGKIKKSSSFYVFAGILLVSLVSALGPGRAFGRQAPNAYELLRQQQTGNTGSVQKDAGQGQTRVVHFPPDRSLGRLMIQDANSVRKLAYWFHWTGNGESPREYLCEAQGDVHVPAGKRLCLQICSKAAGDLAALERLGPDDLYSISYPHMPPGQAPPRTDLMQHITHLTGLKRLALDGSPVSDTDMQHITSLRCLEYLSLPDRITDAGLAHVASLTCLKGLYLIGGKSRIRDEGLRHISKISSLEELYLGGEYMTDTGLEHLKKLPKLEYLCLYGSGFTDDGCVHIKEMPSLRILSFHENLCRISDAGLVYISQMPKLEILCLGGMKNITDEGITYLTKMPSLRKLDIASSQVTDRGLEYLSQIKTLECLELPRDQKGITDRGLEYLGRLTNLKHLSISRIHFNDPKMNKEYYTDRGLEYLSRCSELEELNIGSIGITDAGVEHIVRLTGLKSLGLFGCDNVTDSGFAKLTALKLLESLTAFNNDITIAGLNRLGSLSSLKRLHILDVRRGGAVLDLSGMTGLEYVIISFSPKSGDAFNDADLACLKDLKMLGDLQIGPREFTDSGLRYLDGLTQMGRLALGGSKLTDAGIRHLAGMKKLHFLNISSPAEDAKLTDETLRFLEQFKQLSWLDITSDVPFSPAAVQHLQKELPYLYYARIQPTGPQSQPNPNRVRPQTSPRRRRR
jgi:Leucine-rich repeat (LRR) protein